MKIEILNFKKEMKDNSKVYGYLQISVKDSFICWMKVLKNAKGGYFFCTPSLRIEENYAPVFEFTKIDFSKEVYNQVKKQFEADWG